MNPAPGPREGAVGIGRAPWVAGALVVAGALATVVPGWAEALQYDRSRVAAGELGRLLTASFPHWNARMAFWDLLVVGVAGAWVEARSRGRTVLAATAGLLATGLAVDRLAPAVEIYRGSSGLATALFVAAALPAAFESRAAAGRLVAGAALVALVAKIAYEATTGSAAFAGALPDGVRVVPVVHGAGAVAGAMAFAVGGAPRLSGRARGTGD